MEAISYKPFELKFKIWRKKMLGVGGNNQTKLILAHIYPLIYINLHVKYGKYLIRTFRVKIQNMKIYFYFFGGPGGGGGVHKIQGTGTPKCQQMHISSLDTYTGTYIFFKCIFLAIWGALGGAFSDQTERILLSRYPLTHIFVHVK